MEFGIWSNGFRRHTSAAQTYDEDLQELVLADQLGFRDAFISEHHSEPIYIDKVDVLPVPELLMCKAAALTKNIRFGAAIKIAHMQHPVDIAIQAAVTDQVIGNGRFIFGFGSGVPSPVFTQSRGMTFDDRHARLMESLELIRKIWSAKEPFDWHGKFWQGKGIVPEPHPFN
ncbi:MAG: LLM class flavin-dependent oxidoreductase, partial [Alphaproteobacteria bacterium]|nr:LLM class flavin-dependent oxidoreductase [Alphaproteobacteria bacterium]